MYEQINEIPILDVLDRLGIKYKDLGCDTVGLIENAKLTDGRRVSIRGNFINDFSGKGRAQGSPFALVKTYLNLTNYECFQRFRDSFNMGNRNMYHIRGSPPKQKKNMSTSSYSRQRLIE